MLKEVVIQPTRNCLIILMPDLWANIDHGILFINQIDDIQFNYGQYNLTSQ